MEVGQKIFKLVGLKLTSYKIKEIAPTGFMLSDIETRDKIFVRNLNDQQQYYYISERMALTELKERLEKELKKVDYRLQEKVIKYIQKDKVEVVDSDLQKATQEYAKMLKEIKSQ